MRDARRRGGWGVRDIERYRAAQARYDVSKKGRAARARFGASEEGREAIRESHARYNGSFKGLMRNLDCQIRRQQKVAAQLKDEMHVA